MINLTDIVYNILNDSTIDATIDKNKVEPTKAQKAISVGYSDRKISRTSQTYYEIDSRIAISIMVVMSDNYAETLNTLVDAVIVKVLTDKTFASGYNVDNVNVSYDYSEAGDLNLAQSVIVLDVTHTEQILPIFNVDFTSIHYDVDLAANDTIDDTFLVSLPQ